MMGGPGMMGGAPAAGSSDGNDGKVVAHEQVALLNGDEARSPGNAVRGGTIAQNRPAREE